jgi:hypothetical protein
MRLERRRSGGWSEPVIHETLSTMRAVYERLPGDGYYVQVPGVFHADMTDVPMLASRAGLSGPVGVQRAHQIINAYSLAFFDRHLKGQPAVLLMGQADPGLPQLGGNPAQVDPGGGGQDQHDQPRPGQRHHHLGQASPGHVLQRGELLAV